MKWPSLSYNIVTVAGVNNPLQAPVYMVKLDTANAVTVGTQDIEYTLPEIPGFKLTVKAGSVTFPDGSKTGQISVTPVNANKVPMPPPNAMQPQFIVTIQPAGAMFDPPASLTFPNVDGHPPGAQVELYSYDHDLEEFVTIGLGTVSKDGSVIESNPGVGVVKAGWHCGSQPNASGCTHNCANYCDDCNGNCQCELVPKRPLLEQSDNDCRLNYCDGTWIAQPETPDDTPCRICEAGNPKNVPNEPVIPCGDGSPEESCLVCVNGICQQPDCDADPLKLDKSLVSWGAGGNWVDSTLKIMDTIPWLAVEISNPKAELKVQTGEECCKHCQQPDKGIYKQLKGDASLTGKVTFVLPGTGGIWDIDPREVLPGVFVSGSITFGVVGDLSDIDVGVHGQIKTTACTEENQCISRHRGQHEWFHWCESCS